MPNSYFQFKQFIIHQDRSAMKVTTDGCLFGAAVSSRESGVRSREPVPDSNQRKKVFDIGTGTGLLALMLAQDNDCLIDAIEIDKDAFEQARGNIAASPWANRINVIHGDIREFTVQQQYDIIISNPPFYENELKSDNTKKNLAHHNEGLLLPNLLEIIKKNLAPDGSFYLLLPYKRKEEIKKLAIENNLAIQQLTFVRQSVNHDYFRIMLNGKLKSAEPTKTMIDEIAIKDKNDQYTAAFKDLLKDYYLHL